MTGNVEYLSFRRAPASLLWQFFQNVSGRREFLFVTIGQTTHLFTFREEVTQDKQPAWLRISLFLSGKVVFINLRCKMEKEAVWR